MRIDDDQMKLQFELAAHIEKYTREDGTYSTPIPYLHFVRASEETELIHSIHDRGLCIVAQGTKLVMLANESYIYGPSNYLVVSLQLPVSGQVIEASAECPYLCLRLDFTANQIYDLVKHSQQSPRKPSTTQRGLVVNRMNPSLLDAVVRLVRLLDTPEDISVLAPLITREILYRILQGAQGQSIKQFAMIGSSAERLAKVTQLIERDYNKPLRITELASAVNMSSSSLHHHFKEITAMSPLQYQKQLRLQEARRLLLSETTEAADAGYQVGYESPTQFNREYTRMFGMPPVRDIKRLRESLGIR